MWTLVHKADTGSGRLKSPGYLNELKTFDAASAFAPWRDEDLCALCRTECRPSRYGVFPGACSPVPKATPTWLALAYFAEHDYGLWAVEELGGAPFIGYVGLNTPRFDAPFMPAVEIGWRLAFAHWGKGFAREAANAALDFGFDTLHLDQIVSFTATANQRSRRVMEVIGMTHSAGEDFDHPSLAEGHPLRRHVLYRISRQEWEQMRKR